MKADGTVTLSGDGTITVTYEGEMPALEAAIAAIEKKLADEGYKNVTISKAGSTYTFSGQDKLGYDSKFTWDVDTDLVEVITYTLNGKETTAPASDEITYVYIAKNDKQLAELIYVIDGEFTATVYDDDAKASERVGNINAFLATNGYTAADLTTLKTEMEGYLTNDISAAVKADVEAVIKALADAQTALTADQTAAKAELNSYKETALNTYEDKLTGTEVREIEAIVSAANAKIDAAAKNAIDGIVTQAKSDIDGKTTGAAGALADEKKVKDAKAALGDVTLSPVASTSAPDADAIKAKLPVAADGVTYAVSAAGEEDTFTATVTVTITAGEAQDTKEIQASYVATDYKTVKDAVDGIGKAVSVEVSSSGIDANAAETALKSALESKYTGTTITADIAGNVTGSEGDVVTKSASITVAVGSVNYTIDGVVVTITLTA